MPAAPTIAYGGTTFTVPELLEYPHGYDATDARRGKVAETLTFTTLLRPSQLATVKTLYAAWNAARLVQEPPERTGVVGATATVNATGPGFTWTNRAAWFNDVVSSPAAGGYLRTTIALVDANQALAVILRDLEEAEEEYEALSLGTITLGSAVINLTAQPDVLEPPPAPNLSPAGAHVLTGPLVAIERREVRGWVTAANLTNLRAWFNTTVAATPATGAWFPTGSLQPEARQKRNGGVVSIVYDVSLSLVKIRGAA